MNEHEEDSGGCSLVPVMLLVLAVVVVLWVALPNFVHGPHRKTNRENAIGALKTLGIAQTLFREADTEGDGNLDYGALAELAPSAANVGLIDSVLGSGTKAGFLFEATYGASTSELLWFGTARPTVPGLTGKTYFCTNHEGAIFYTLSAPFALNGDDCTIPAGAVPVGR